MLAVKGWSCFALGNPYLPSCNAHLIAFENMKQLHGICKIYNDTILNDRAILYL